MGGAAVCTAHGQLMLSVVQSGVTLNPEVMCNSYHSKLLVSPLKALQCCSPGRAA